MCRERSVSIKLMKMNHILCLSGFWFWDKLIETKYLIPITSIDFIWINGGIYKEVQDLYPDRITLNIYLDRITEVVLPFHVMFINKAIHFISIFFYSFTKRIKKEICTWDVLKPFLFAKIHKFKLDAINNFSNITRRRTLFDI